MNYADSILIMDDRINSSIKKKIMPGSRFWNKNLAEQKEIINRIKSLKEEENLQFGLTIPIPSRNRHLYCRMTGYICPTICALDVSIFQFLVFLR